MIVGFTKELEQQRCGCLVPYSPNRDCREGTDPWTRVLKQQRELLGGGDSL